MKIIDLSHAIASHMPVYPGAESPVFTIDSSIEDAGFLERKITLFSHTGTHVDAPSHMMDGGISLDRLPADRFFGRAISVDLTSVAGEIIGMDEVTPYADLIGSIDFVLLRTGWSRYWGENAYFSGYPVLSHEAAQWLSGFALKGIGMDVISADAADSADYPIHKLFLNRCVVLIENLTGLDRLPRGPFWFSCLPLKFKDADGSPVRAVAILYVRQGEGDASTENWRQDHD